MGIRDRSSRGARGAAGAAVVAVMLVASACSGDGDSSDSADGKSGIKTLVIARNMDLTSTDPSQAICDTCQFVFSATYETLVGLADDNHTLTPRLAKSWDANDDNTKYTFHLDPKAKFRDGSKVTSADVKFSFLRLKNLKGSASYLAKSIDTISAPDPKTVVFKLHAPNAEFPNIVNAPYTAIINSKLAKQQGASDASNAPKKDTAEKWFQSHSAGSGPYELASFTEDSEVTLTANPNYWGTSPPIKRIVVKQAKTAASQAQMLQNGDADMAMQIDPITAKSLQGRPGTTVKTIPSFNFFWLGMSPNIKVNTQAPLNDKIRQAVRLAIDYKALLNTMVAGSGRLQASPIPNGYPGSAELPLPKTDVNQAKQLLSQAGVANGFTVTLGYPAINAYGVDLGQLAQLVQSQLKKVNINVKLRPATFAVNISDYSANKLPMNLLYWAPDYFGTTQYFDYFGQIPGSSWSQRSAETPTSPPVIDKTETKLFDKALNSTDPKQRNSYFQQGGQQMIDNAVTIPLFSPNLVLAYRDDLKGVGYSACCNIKLWSLS